MAKAGLGKRQQQKKCTLSPIHLLLGAVALAAGFLLLNLSALRRATEKIQEAAVSEPDSQLGKANPLLQKAAQALPMIAGGPASGVPQYHIIFSTGCNTFSDWQSYLFFFHAAKALNNAKPPLSAMQNTHVTRIASGCSDDAAADMKKYHKDQINIMTNYNNFHLHLTPDFSHVHGQSKEYKYFNKPYGSNHFMENVLGYKEGQSRNKYDDLIIVLCDPDQIILRPFTNDFSKNPETWRKRTALPYWEKVTHGQPFAAHYGFHNQWYGLTNITQIARPEELPSPIETMDRNLINENYSVGPPYIATARDFDKIARKWKEFGVPVHKQHPHLLAEMFAYCNAAAHLKLPHQVAQSFMVSDVSAGNMEGWKRSVDAVEADAVCKEGGIPNELLPNVLHYCQRYWLGKWFIGKYKLPKDFISCHTPLLMEPPDGIALEYTFAVKPNGEIAELRPEHVKRNAFALCYFIRALNEAASFYKEKNCKEGNANMEKTLIFHDSIEIKQ